MARRLLAARRQRGYVFLTLLLLLLSVMTYLFSEGVADISRQKRVAGEFPSVDADMLAAGDAYYRENPDWTTLDLPGLARHVWVATGVSVTAELLLVEENPTDRVRWRSIALRRVSSAPEDFSGGDAVVIDGEEIQREALEKLRGRMSAIAQLLQSYHAQRVNAAGIVNERINPFGDEEQHEDYFSTAVEICADNETWGGGTLAEIRSRCEAQTQPDVNHYDVPVNCGDKTLAPVECGDGIRPISEAGGPGRIIPPDLFQSPFGGQILYHTRPVADGRAAHYAALNSELEWSHTNLTNAGLVLVADLPGQTVEWLVVLKKKELT